MSKIATLFLIICNGLVRFIFCTSDNFFLFLINSSTSLKIHSEVTLLNIIGVAIAKRPIVSVVRKDNIYGMQFHPEISQISGFKLMRRLLKEFTHA